MTTMEDINEEIISQILNQSYKDEPSLEYLLKNIPLQDKNIIILCGSGLTKDYGIDTFEEMKRGNYYDIFSFSKYETDLINFYQNINLLKKKCSQLVKIPQNQSNIFVVTTNIDGMFVGNNLFETHGNIFEYKCLHCNIIFSKDTELIPLCMSCNNIVRPNIQFYCDGDFRFNERQMKKYIDFKNACSKENTLIFEVGCGLSVPLLRHETYVLKQKGYDVYRVNIKDFDDNTNSIKMSGKIFIEYIMMNHT